MPDAELEFECPLCGGAFAIGAEWLGHEVECPHCGHAVELATPEAAADEPAIAEPPPQPAPSPDPSAEPLVESEPPPVEAALEPTPAAAEAPATEPPAPQEPAPAPPAPRPERPPLTKAEREALRKRVNMILAGVFALVLVMVFVVLAIIAE
ncbi:MAG: hypothetical protein AAGJ46_00645 [Planctomycetota bacterium]